MNPIKVFLSIFAGAILLAVILGLTGLYQSTTDVAEEEEGDSILADAPAALVQNCLSCHGQQLEGSVGPTLIGIDYTEEEIIDIIQNGIGTMMPVQGLSDEEQQQIAEYLVQFEE